MIEFIEPLSKEVVLAIHSESLSRFGGLDGVRDEGLLESALAQPFQTFNGTELYPTTAMKAARYAFGIIKDHPFADGNKRTAVALMGLYMRQHGYAFRPSHKELLSMALGVADGSISFTALVEWVNAQA